MALGRQGAVQDALLIGWHEVPIAPGHVFYDRLNALLDTAGFDGAVEALCQAHYASGVGRPSVPPGRYFRMLFVGYFEGLDSQRGIAWRCADSLSLRQFLGVPLDEATPDHSTLTNTRNRLPQEVFQEVFQFVLRMAAGKKLLSGKTVAVDSTTLEANAAMKSIVRRDSGEDWKQYVTRLMREDGTIKPDEEPTHEQIRRYDKKRKNKKVSNDEWKSPNDADSRITQLKDGRTHLAYKAEHVVDLKSDLVLAAEIHKADQADTDTLVDSVMQAQINLKQAGSEKQIKEVAADKGYHAGHTLELCESVQLRTYIPEPRRPHGSRWTDKPAEVKHAVLANRRRIKRDKSKRWQRLRSELCERTFAHICNRGGMRRSWLKGVAKVAKRYLIAAAAHNLGRILFKLLGIGKPKTLQGEGGLAALVYLIVFGWWSTWTAGGRCPRRQRATRAHLAA